MSSLEIMRRLSSEVAELRALLPHAAVLAPAVSGWSIGEHISHLALAAPYVVSQVRGPSSTDPGLTSAGPEFMAMLAAERIPRGPLKPPAQMRSPRSGQAHLVEDLERAEQCILGLEPDMARFMADPGLVQHPNPGFGGLTRLQWLRAMSIHQRHHLGIIAEILLHT